MTSTDAPTIALRYDPLPAGLAADAARKFVEEDGGRPLRCCLRDSRPGERLALVAVTGAGDKAQATVDFGSSGTKRLVLRFAPLVKL